VNCAAVRGLLTERALGIAGARERGAVERHLSWCAACRREAGDLDGAAVTLAFALEPAAADPSLEERVVGSIREAAAVSGAGGRGGAARRTRRRPRRRLVALLAAALLGLSVAGGGAVLASREGTIDPQQVADRQKDRLARFADAWRSAEFAGAGTVLLGTLSDTSGGPRRGSAVAILSARGADQVLVIGTGLSARRRFLPYTVRLTDAGGSTLDIGSVLSLSSGGSFRLAWVAAEDLGGNVTISVWDGSGRCVLIGTLREETPLPSPAG
jgi:hypothetical protein